MADPAFGFGRDDLRAGVAAGLLTEPQAAGILALAEARHGARLAQPEEDEPFELFRGFAEIFVSVGLVLLLAGVIGLSALFGSPLLLMAVTAGACWWFARYFTLKRRMVLPSIVLVCGYAAGIGGVAASFAGGEGTAQGLLICALIAAGLALWYRVFRLPFTMFLLGLTGLAAVAIVTDSITPDTVAQGWDAMFDLRAGSGLALGTLAFGLAAFAGGMWFDSRDPHRLGRYSASGFWLHLLAAPALVNTVALTFYNMGPGAGYALLAVALALIAVLALVIDRRSFLTAGIGYLAFLITLVARQGGDLDWPWVVLILGAVITGLGAYWTHLRARLMRALPDFPGKRRLPPYLETP